MVSNEERHEVARKLRILLITSRELGVYCGAEVVE